MCTRLHIAAAKTMLLQSWMEIVSWSLVTGILVAVVFKSRRLVWDVPMAVLEMKVMGAVLIGLGLCLLQLILGPMRRRYRHWSIKYGAMAAYNVPILIAYYVASALWSSSDCSVYYVVWCIILTWFSARDCDAMTAYTLSDNRPVMRLSLVRWVFYLSFLQWGLSARNTGLIFLALLCFAGNILIVLITAKKPFSLMELVAKAFAEYMVGHISNNNIYNYPFILNYSERIGVMDLKIEDGVVWDTCLSYSFSHLLARRYFCLHCSEEGDPRVRQSVLSFLASRRYSRAFKIIDEQLAFLHDYFFTSYHLEMLFTLENTSPAFEIVRTVMEVLVPKILLFLVPVQALFWLLVLFFIHGSFGVPHLAFYLTASFILATLMWFEENTKLGPAYWRVVHAAARINPYGKRYGPSCQTYWREKIGQYSIIEDCDSRSAKKACIAWFNLVLGSELPLHYIGHQPVEDDDVTVPDSAKKKIFELVQTILKGQNCQLTNGSTSLVENRIQDSFSWTLDQATDAHTILIWHIATCYCDMSEAVISDSYDVATALSRYCAYLVAFLPEFLPGHRFDTKALLQEVLKDAKETMAVEEEHRRLQLQVAPQDQVMAMEEGQQPLLQSHREHGVPMEVEECSRLQQVVQKAKYLLQGQPRMSRNEKREKMANLHLSENMLDLNTFEKGAKLGQKLMELDNSVYRWKLMAEFWAETLLYIAPSDNVAAHIEHLAKGGEFVTHLWAMLSNAGILKRPERRTDAPTNPPQPPASPVAKQPGPSNSLREETGRPDTA